MLYFAFGSNMLRARLEHRVGRVGFARALTLDGFRLCFHKRSEDGSGKCDMVETGEIADRVHGVLWELGDEQLDALDEFEGAGYERATAVADMDGTLRAFIYYRAQPDWIDDRLRPYDWYLDLVMAGAREQELPAGCIAVLTETPSQADPEPDRPSRLAALKALQSS